MCVHFGGWGPKNLFIKHVILKYTDIFIYFIMNEFMLGYTLTRLLQRLK